MTLSIDDFYFFSNDKIKINKWLLNLENNSNNIPLVITGKSGTGKTELVNTICPFIQFAISLLHLKFADLPAASSLT